MTKEATMKARTKLERLANEYRRRTERIEEARHSPLGTSERTRAAELSAEAAKMLLLDWALDDRR